MTSTSEIRAQFLDFFRSQNHHLKPSAPLVPANDPTLMFTNAGMVQFKDVFTGERKPPAPRVATVQKCIRISGKHNDLENVGRTSRHHTFFEMLGNFSFGDYFKKEACRLGWELLTKGFGFDADRLWVTVFAGDDTAPADDDAAEIWRDVVGVPAERIQRLGAKDNFWAMGDIGPCGPCSEIHYDRGEAFGASDIENGERFFELWNLVFMQYMVREPGGSLEPLPHPCIDTGAGLERIASVLQNVETNYDIDIFEPLIKKAAAIAHIEYGAGESDVSLRVIADHARMAAFLIAEGVFPEKTGREYVLRRVMRRAIRHGHRLGIDNLFFHEVAETVVEVMHEPYPELAEHRDLISRVCRQEEERFRETLGRGLELLGATSDWKTGSGGERILPGEVAFDLTATYGFPRDLIEVIGEEDGFIIDETGYLRAEERHRAVSGAGKIGETAVAPIYKELKDSLGETTFAGYEHLARPTQVLAVIRDGKTVEHGNEGAEIEVVLGETPFYGESGGQVGDTGTISSPGGVMSVQGTQVPVPGLFIHKGRVDKGRLRVADEVEARVDEERRATIRRHHTATHLLHTALRQVLGSHATQKGSRVDPDGLRFDFAHFEPMSEKQRAEVEELVAAKVRENHPVDTEELTYTEAKNQGAMALFGENYGDRVRMVTVSADSVELCGGTHVLSSGDIGDFFIINETGIAAGVRRIEAVAGHTALTWIREQREILLQAAGLLKTAPKGLPDRVTQLLSRERDLTKEIENLKRKLAAGGQDLMENVRVVDGIKVIGARIEVGDPAALRDTVDALRGKLDSGVICLGGEKAGKAALVVGVTKDLTKSLNAGRLIREVAEIVGGRGGGRPDLAQAGGPEIGRLDAAVEEIYDAVARAMKKQARTK
ncbi:MAG: alanine--tRNA ligase [Deltaproteobacteria bacterium]|nr:alanine--tRNA ligase [Deltaproteobacteria bacterium]